MIRCTAIVAALAIAGIVVAGPPRLTVQGVATLEVPADQFSLTIGAVASAATVTEARTEVDTTMAKLVKLVTDLGLVRDSEWHTGRYDVDPQWKPRPQRSQRSEAWTPEIIGYSVRSSLSITSQKLTLAGTLVAKGAKAGATEIGSLKFSLSDPRSSRAKAIRTATTHAVADATTLADAAGVSLVQILQISLDGAEMTPPRPIEYKSMATAHLGRAAFDMESAPDITAGTVKVTASVTAEWEIAPTHGAQIDPSGSPD
jgi:uncharacterized protein YggE